MQGRSNLSAGSKINGIKKEFSVVTGGNVSVGDFVKWLSKYNDDGDYPQTLNESNQSGYVISATPLDNNRFFIIYYGDSSLSNLYGVVATLSENEITLDTPILLANTNTNGWYAEIKKISNNKLFLLFGTLVSTTKYLKCAIINIDSEVSISEPVQIYSGEFNSWRAAVLNENKVAVTYSYTSSKYLGANICSIADNEIIVSSQKTLVNDSLAGEYIETTQLSEDKIFVAHSKGNKSLYGLVYTINGTNIISGTDTQLSSTTKSALNPSIAKINENKVFISHMIEISSSNRQLYGLVCTIDNTTITAGTDTQLSIVQTQNIYSAVESLNESKIFVAYYHGANLYKVICDVSNTLSVDNSTQVANDSGASGGICLIKLNSMVILYSKTNNRQLASIICGLFSNGVTKLETNTDSIFGIAQSKGNSGDTVKVYVPNIIESESD